MEEQTMADPVVLYETDDKVGIITLNRPDKLNAISHDLQHALTVTACSLPSRQPVAAHAGAFVSVRNTRFIASGSRSISVRCARRWFTSR
jgi:hypothetical protein